jgi:hypothetical protein
MLRRPLFIVYMLLIMARVAPAGLVTSSLSFSTPIQLVDFNGFGPGFSNISGAMQVGSPVGRDITLSASGETAVIGTGNFGLQDNGLWTSSKTGYVGAGGSTVSGGGTIIFRFNDGPVSAVGGFVNYGPNALPDFTISALASNGDVLESYDIFVTAPISTPGATNAGAFRGIVRAQADIAAFRISGEAFVIDDFAMAPAPEPSTLALLLAGLTAGWLSRFR